MLNNLKVVCEKEGQIDKTKHPYTFLMMLSCRELAEYGDSIQQNVFYMPAEAWYQVLSDKIPKMKTPFVPWIGRKKKDVQMKYIMKYFHWSSREYRKNSKCLKANDVIEILEKYELNDKERKELGLEAHVKMKIEKPIIKKDGLMQRWINE